MPESHLSLVETLRHRVLRGLQAETLLPGDRLPSGRELVEEFGVDHRAVLAAYRELSDEGLVEIRERGGVYVASRGANNAHAPGVPVSWFVDTLTNGLARNVAGPDLSEWLRRSIETLRLRAIVVSSTEDQVAGLARELREDFGLVAEGITAEAVQAGKAARGSLKRADVLIGTSGHVDLVERTARELGKPSLLIEVRPDLVLGEWALLLRQPVWAIVATAQFGEMLKRFFAGVRGVENLRVLVNGVDDLSQIPERAPTYVTHRVRESLGVTKIRGRILPPARTISSESARRIFEFIVRANLRAMHALQAEPDGHGGRVSGL